MMDAKTRELLEIATHALRSYQHGNSSPALAREVADVIEGSLRIYKTASPRVTDLSRFVHETEYGFHLGPLAVSSLPLDKALDKATSTYFSTLDDATNAVDLVFAAATKARETLQAELREKLGIRSRVGIPSRD